MTTLAYRGRKLAHGGHHGEEELTVGVRPAGVGFEVFESMIALLAVIVHCGDWERKVVGVASAYWYATLPASRIERCVIVPSFDWKRYRFLYEAMRFFWKSLVACFSSRSCSAPIESHVCLTCSQSANFLNLPPLATSKSVRIHSAVASLQQLGDCMRGAHGE